MNTVLAIKEVLKTMWGYYPNPGFGPDLWETIANHIEPIVYFIINIL